jgi:bacterial microcompartment shell protein
METHVAELDTIGILEVTSIGIGYRAEDAMLKAAEVKLLRARPICAGKYLIVVSGDVASVEASVEAGAAIAEGALIEKRVISRIHPSVFSAISMAVDVPMEQVGALGVLETFSASSIVEVADAAVKAADVKLLNVYLAMAIGGKGFLLLTGDVSSVEAAIAAGAVVAGAEGMLSSQAVIPAPCRELFRDYI